jgi:type II secretory pathway pseudopilin PulG
LHFEFQLRFTLIEVLLVQGMIAVIAGIVIIAISPRKNFVTVRDTERKHYAKQLNQAMNTYLIEEWKMPSNESIPTCVEDNKITCGKPICKATVDDSDCLNENAVPLSILPPTYISALPVDIVMDNNDNCIGYMVYQNIGRSYVFNPNMGKLEGDDPHEESECGEAMLGSGVPGDPYHLGNCQQLQDMELDLAAHYI